ncbi:MAG: TonB-dependent receptor plug domain-containing protein [Bacteroidia bacterium]|jgi:hypothetical protein
MLTLPGFRRNPNNLIILWLPLLLLILPAGVRGQTDSLTTDSKPRDGIARLDATSSCQRQILTAQQIKLSGYTRLTELVQLFDAFTFSTSLGQNWQLNANGMNPLHNTQCVIMLNGQRIQYNLTQVFALNELGISVNDIERIELVHTPDLYLGEFADKGLIHIVTKNNFKGLLYRGHMAYGYDVLQQMPHSKTFSQTFGFSKKGFAIQVSQNAYLTEVYDRATSSYWTSINPLQATRLHITYSHKRVTHQLQGNLHLKHGLLNFDLTRPNNLYSLGYLNHITLKPGHSFRTSVNLASNSTASFENKGYLVQSNVYHHYRKPFRKDQLQLKTGLGFDYSFLPYRYFFYGQTISTQTATLSNKLIKPFVSLTVPLTRKLWLTTDLQGVSNTHDFGYKTCITLYKRISLISNWSLVGSYNKRLLDEDNSLYATYSNLPIHAYSVNRSSDQFTLDANLALNVGNNFKLFFSNGLRYLSHQPGNGDYYNTPILMVDPIYFYPNFSYNLNTTNWIMRFNLHYDVLRNLFMDFNYLRTSQWAGDEAMISGIPKHKTTLVLNYQLPGNFNVWSRFYYQSATQWSHLFSHIYMQNPISMDSRLITDLGLNKSLFKNRMNLNLTINNLFNTTEQYYPYGVTRGPRAQLSLAWNIDQLFVSASAKP